VQIRRGGSEKRSRPTRDYCACVRGRAIKPAFIVRAQHASDANGTFFGITQVRDWTAHANLRVVMTALTIAFLVRTIAREPVFLDPFLRRAPRDHVRGVTGVGKHGKTEISGLSYSVETERERRAFGTKRETCFRNGR